MPQLPDRLGGPGDREAAAGCVPGPRRPPSSLSGELASVHHGRSPQAEPHPPSGSRARGTDGVQLLSLKTRQETGRPRPRPPGPAADDRALLSAWWPGPLGAASSHRLKAAGGPEAYVVQLLIALERIELQMARLPVQNQSFRSRINHQARQDPAVCRGT